MTIGVSRTFENCRASSMPVAWDPAMDPVFEAQWSMHWSSTTDTAMPPYAWSVYVWNGATHMDNKVQRGFVRAVRNAE